MGFTRPQTCTHQQMGPDGAHHALSISRSKTRVASPIDGSGRGGNEMISEGLNPKATERRHKQTPAADGGPAPTAATRSKSDSSDKYPAVRIMGACFQVTPSLTPPSFTAAATPKTASFRSETVEVMRTCVSKN